MKKIISMIMVLCMLAAMFAINTSAAGITTDAPDWIITEIGCDQTGDGTGGWSDSLDPLEYFELYNNSGKNSTFMITVCSTTAMLVLPTTLRP